MRTRLTRSSADVIRPLLISDTKLSPLCLRLRSAPRQQQFSASFGSTEKGYFVSVQVQDSCKPAKQNFHTSLSPCRPRPAPITLRVFHHQLSSSTVSSSSSRLDAPCQLPVFHVDDEIAQLLAFLRPHLLLPVKCQAHELQKVYKWLQRQTTMVLQRPEKTFWILSKRFEPYQDRVTSAGSF